MSMINECRLITLTVSKQNANIFLLSASHLKVADTMYTRSVYKGREGGGRRETVTQMGKECGRLVTITLLACPWINNNSEEDEHTLLHMRNTFPHTRTHTHGCKSRGATGAIAPPRICQKQLNT